MLISVITATYNSEATVKDTLESVLMQSYDNYELLIIDGCSKDGTLDIVQEYKERFGDRLKVWSEKDKGLYDAMNKGIAKANGDVIGILNSDDAFADENVLKNIADEFASADIDGTYGNITFYDAETFSKTVRHWNAGTGSINRGWMPPHPSLYLKKSVYEKFGNFDDSLKIAADYDFMLRIIKGGVKLAYIPKDIVKMRAGGVSTDGISGYVKNLKESHNVVKRNGIRFPLLVDCIRIFKTLGQMLKK